MVVKTYTIPRSLVNREIINFIKSYSEYQAQTRINKFIMNHVNANTESLFQTDLSKKLNGFDIDGTVSNTAKFMDELKTDQLVFVTEKEVTKTNIGTIYTNVFTDFAGRPFYIDTTGFTAMAVQILWTKNGTGTQRVRIVNNADNIEVLESTSLTTQSNDFPSVNIPQVFLNFRGKWRLESKSTVATDSPIFAGCRIYLRR